MGSAGRDVNNDYEQKLQTGGDAPSDDDTLRFSFSPARFASGGEFRTRGQRASRLIYHRRTFAQEQSVRAEICTDPREYPHTHVNVELEEAVRRAINLKAFMEGVPYKRYDHRRKSTR